jgi:broad specificity phosphatase PhoE
MEIVLARHGKPKLDQGAWIAPRQIEQWRDAYNAADIFTPAAAPRVSIRALQSGVIVSSPLPRCVQSLRLLAPSRDIQTEELFREAGIPYAQWEFPRLPLSLWAVIFRIAWFCGYSSHSESVALATIRAGQAAQRLIDLARQHESVFLMGHGIMGALIAKHLICLGWLGPKRPANQYWQYGVYRFP